MYDVYFISGCQRGLVETKDKVVLWNGNVARTNAGTRHVRIPIPVDFEEPRMYSSSLSIYYRRTMLLHVYI